MKVGTFEIVATNNFRLLDAECADWQEGARIVLHVDAIREPARARKATTAIWRAKWMARLGYRDVLGGG